MSENCTHNCETCGENCASRKTNPADFREPPHALSSIKKVIGVVSGKGGVGKSMTSAMLAVLLNRRGYKTGVLDADITGPSIPKLFGIHGRAHADEVGCYPVQSRTGIDVMSVNLLLEHESDPVVWRGPIIAGTVKQFWQEVIWKDVDFLFVDMPPGTGDVPLTVFQTLPVDGIVVVASPQELVSLIVAKAVNMANMMNIRAGPCGKHELCPVPGLRQKNRRVRREPRCRDSRRVRRSGAGPHPHRPAACQAGRPRCDRIL